jgi:UDP-glucuronate 4-epimerase
MRLLVTGATGQVGLPVAKALAREHEVFAAARFRDPDAKAALEAAGAACVTIDLVRGDFDDVPIDLDAVIHFGVTKTNRWDKDLAGNAEAAGLLMARCRGVQAFLHCSSTAVYQPAGQVPRSEDSPLGDNHRPVDFLSTYSISKIAAEQVVRTTARLLDVPTTIARLSVPYGDNGGWPGYHVDFMLGDAAIDVHADGPSTYNPIHEDDLVAHIPRLLEIASVPATTVNWGGDDAVSIEEWCGYLGELTGLTPRFNRTPAAIPPVVVDLTKQHELVGRCSVHWRDGMRRMVESRHPELLK